MIAVYPPLVCLVFLSRYVLHDVPMVVSLFVFTFCLTGLSTGLILPFLHRRLHGWPNR
jgi:antibiotic biosynthesis monooxygenase (ABM) superfamily enzyme